MYTFRPLEAWRHFYQASVFYQFYLRSVGEPISDQPSTAGIHRLHRLARRGRRLEQSLYWSCFKSEVEMRVELPLLQSSIVDFEYPDMFPSPPSPPPFDVHPEPTAPSSFRQAVQANYSSIRSLHESSSIPVRDDPEEVRPHSRKLYNEEESWYYYLTEVALRRISNRIVNTFYQQHQASWAHIKPLIPLAIEFEAQISTWSANLPPAMQHYESSSPRFPSANGAASPNDVLFATRGPDQTSASKELSWATANRLLEMQTWLYQPFLYYAIHHSTDSEDVQRRGSYRGSYLSADDFDALHGLIAAGVECNLRTLESRSLLHRHHGIWFDLRSLMAAIVTLAAAALSGHVEVPAELFADESVAHHVEIGERPLQGERRDRRLKLAFDALKYWEDESPDLPQARALLEELVESTKDVVARRSNH